MKQSKLQISDTTLMSFVAYAVLLAVAILGIQILESGVERIIGIILLLAFALIFILSPGDDAPAWRWHLHLSLLTAITAALMVLQPNWGAFPMLFFILSPTAMMVFPQRTGYLWIGIFTLVTGVVFLLTSNPLDAFSVLLPFAAGYWFFGAFARAMISAQEARIESQRLLAELQTAHRQLQEYAAHAEELAVSEERNRLAREMHDTIGHRMTVAAVQLEGAQRLIPTDPDRAAGMVSTVREQVRAALHELRATVATLREPLQTDLNITAALDRLAAEFEGATGLPVGVEIAPELPPLPQPYRLTIYRAAQEALTNVQRHAAASQVWLQLAAADDTISLNVHDDGVGFPPERSAEGFGLHGMHERAAHLDGTLHLENLPTGGAQLRLVLPLEKDMDHGTDSPAAS